MAGAGRTPPTSGLWLKRAIVCFGIALLCLGLAARQTHAVGGSLEDVVARAVPRGGRALATLLAADSEELGASAAGDLAIQGLQAEPLAPAGAHGAAAELFPQQPGEVVEPEGHGGEAASHGGEAEAHGGEAAGHGGEAAGHGGEAGHGHEKSAKHVHGYVSLLFLFGGLTIGMVLQVLQERYVQWMPYTCMLFLAGLVLAVIHHYRESDVWYDSVQLWEEVDPHLVFFVFLPALIFSEAMKLNIKVASAVFGQVLVLACPGVILGTGLTALFSRMVLPYDWSWSTSLVFGSILAATDPVAVVSLFNTLGVSPRLTLLISGESLLNDGTAIVLFSLMMKVLTGEDVTHQSAAVFFIRMTVLAVFLGVLCAIVALIIINVTAETRYHTDTMIQVMATICTAFLSFFLAEKEMGTSGVITVVSAGCVFAYLAWPRFVSKEFIEIVWETIEFVGNTIIFLLAGLLFGHRVSSRAEYLHWTDGLWLLVLYVGVTLIRAIMVLLSWPILNMLGQKVTWKEAIVMIWSGLRGAVGLVLAIIVDTEPKVDQKVGAQVIFLVGGIAMITIAINATFAAPLLRLLGLTKAPALVKHTVNHFERVSEQHVQQIYEEITNGTDPRFVGADLDRVQANVKALQPRREQSSTTHDKDEKLGMFRQMFLRAVMNAYWSDIDGGLIPRTSKVSRILLHSVEHAVANYQNEICDWEVLQTRIMEATAKPCMNAVISVWPLSKVPEFRHWFPSQDAVDSWKGQSCLLFMEGHETAKKHMAAQFQGSIVFVKDIQEQIFQESDAEVSKARERIQELPAELVQKSKSRMLSGKLIQEQLEKVQEFRKLGFLDAKGANQIIHRINVAQGRVATIGGEESSTDADEDEDDPNESLTGHRE